jgi:hypothetical protein
MRSTRPTEAASSAQPRICGRRALAERSPSPRLGWPPERRAIALETMAALKKVITK